MAAERMARTNNLFKKAGWLCIAPFVLLVYGLLIAPSSIKYSLKNKKFQEHAAIFINFHTPDVTGSQRETQLQEKKVDSKLVPFLVAAQAPHPIHIVKVGANQGSGFNRPGCGHDTTACAVHNPHSRGLLIEPVPTNFELLKKNVEPYAERFECINAAVSTAERSGSMTFYAMNDTRVLAEKADAPHYFLYQLGSFNREHVALRVRKMGKSAWNFKHDVDYYISEMNIEALSASTVMKRLQERFPTNKQREIDLLHVDAEGFDWQITKAFLRVTRPNSLIFEHRHMDSADLVQARNYLRSFGYITWKVENDLFALQVGEGHNFES